MILPSILEYSSFDLNKKILYLLKNYESQNFRDSAITEARISNFTKKLIKGLSLHLDFVLPQFAKDRGGILASQSLESVFESFLVAKDLKLNLTVHLMGELEDMFQAWVFFENLELPETWNLTLFIAQKYYKVWKNYFVDFDFGIWLDLDEWYLSDLEEARKSLRGQTKILIMTVQAGKSGQKLILETKIKLSSLLKQGFSSKYLILDGGWDQAQATKFVQESEFKNIDFVSYTGFWSKVM
jgi:hypothetical protein